MAYQKLIISESLELPSGKAAMDMPYSHYRKLARKHGYVKVVRSLGQLAAWNANKNPDLSEWARDFQRKLKKEFAHNESVETLLEKPSKPFEPKKKKIKISKKHKEIAYYAAQGIGKEIGLPLKMDEESINPQDPIFNGNLSFNVTGATAEDIYKKAVEEYDPKSFNYDSQWKAMTIRIMGGRAYLILYGDAKKIDPKKINPSKRKGSEKITDIGDLVKRRLLKFDKGTIVPYTKDETIVDYNGEYWIMPVKAGDEGGVEYTFKDNLKPQVMVRMK